MFRNLLLAGMIMSVPATPLLAVSSSGNVENTYDPYGDFSLNDAVDVATAPVCNGDYVIDGKGCITAELKEGKFDLEALYNDGINRVVNVIDDKVNNVYVYIFRTDITKNYDMISISNSMNVDTSVTDKVGYIEEFYNYPIKPISISSDGHLIKYKIDGIKINQDKDSNRRYLVRELFNSENDEDLNNVFYSSENEFRINRYNEVLVYDKNLVVITDKKVGYDLIMSSPTQRDSVAYQNYFMFFNVDEKTQKILEENKAFLSEANVSYRYFDYVGAVEYEISLWNGVEDFLVSDYTTFYGNNLTKDKNVHAEFDQSVMGQFVHWKVDIPVYKEDKLNIVDVNNKIIKPEENSVVTCPGKFFCFSTYEREWNSLGLTEDLVTDNTLESFKKIVKEYEWYINFDLIKTYLSLANFQFDNGSKSEGFILGGGPTAGYADLQKFREVIDSTINSLEFTFEDGQIYDVFAVDVYTDSDGYIPQESPRPQTYKWFIIVFLIILGVIVLILGFPIFKFLFKGLWIVLKCIVWIPYLVFVYPFKVAYAKANGETAEMWKPIK